VPHVLHDLAARASYGADSGESGAAVQVSRKLLADQRVYAAYENYEDLDYIVQYAGEDNLVAATDYGHTGQTAITDALQQLNGRVQRGEAEQRLIDKMLRQNPARLFGIEPAQPAG